MKTIQTKHINWLLLISALFLVAQSCRQKKEIKDAPVESVKELPKPATDPSVDSLKHTLDEERARRLQQKP